MSLILEALKRSEAERRLGEAPDLLSPPPEFVSAPSPRRSRVLVVGGIAAALLMVAAFASWWLAVRNNGNASPPAAQGREAAAMQTAEMPPRDVPADRGNSPALLGIPSNPPPNPAVSIPSTVSPNLPPDPTAPLMPPDTVTGRSPVAVEPQAAPEGERPIGPPTIPPDGIDTSVATAAPVDDGAAPAAAAVPAPPMPTAVPVPAPEPAATAPAPVVVEESPATDMPERSDLPLAIRQSLPPLVLNMHLYRATPSERVVILDGKRLHEGESVGDIQLIEIRSDGVVLVAQGQRFLLSRLPR